MSGGIEYSLASFGWNATQTAAVQRANVQSALDSGESLRMPINETVSIDGPLIMAYCRSLIGAGGDITQQALGYSQFRCGEAAADMLKITAPNAYVAGINFHGDGARAAGGARGIVVGEGCADHVRGLVLDRVTTNAGHAHGIHMVRTGGFVLKDSWLWGFYSALRLQNTLSPDTGDNKITNCDFNASAEAGAGLRWTSGGGLYITGSKFNMGLNHINIDWNEGSSGNFGLVNSSLETCAGISVDIKGNKVFKRAWMVGNTWGVNSVAVAVRNFNQAYGDAGTPWLEDLLIANNAVNVGGAVPCFDLGCTRRAMIGGNAIYGAGAAASGITIRPQAVDTGIAPNLIRGCAVPVQNFSGSSSIAAQL